MSIVLGCIADDYTGASDLANTLTKNGLRTVQTVGIRTDTHVPHDIDAVVVSLKIRSVPAPEAVEAARRAERWLRAAGASHILYKICSTFDSTDAGNIGPVIDALRADCGAGTVVVTPAFPETRRTVYLAHLFVGGELLSDSPLKDHPLNPMRDANLARVLARQSAAPVGVLDFATVSAGREAALARLATLSADGVGAAIADAITEGDLETIGAAALAQPFSTGASGLGMGLARALLETGRIPRRHASEVETIIGPVGGLAAVVAGSCSSATLRQIEAAEGAMPVYRLDTEALLAGGDEVSKAIVWATERIADGPVLIAASALPDVVRRLQANHGREESGRAIEAATSAIAEGLVARGVRRLVVAGGETSGAAVDALGIAAFVVGPEIAPGVPLLRTIGRDGAELQMALKSGNFGGADFFASALCVMR